MKHDSSYVAVAAVASDDGMGPFVDMPSQQVLKNGEPLRRIMLRLCPFGFADADES
jgi:hypothetical protein